MVQNYRHPVVSFRAQCMYDDQAPEKVVEYSFTYIEPQYKPPLSPQFQRHAARVIHHLLPRTSIPEVDITLHVSRAVYFFGKFTEG